MINRAVAVFSLLILLPTVVVAAEADGGYAGAFLRMGMGATPVAMGGAFVAVADDASTVYYNPAGSAFIERRTFGASYRAMSLDRSMSMIAYVQPLRGQASVGVGWVHAGVGDIQGYDINGNPTETLSDSENLLSFAFSKRLISRLSVGLGIEYVQQKVADISAYGLGFDVGILFKPLPDLAIGLALQDLRSKFKWDTQDLWDRGTTTHDEIPANIRFGLSYRMLEDRFLYTVDVEKNAEQEVRYHLGSAFQAYSRVNLRLGYDDDRFTFGGGVIQSVGRFDLLLDYAYLPGRVETNATQLFSLGAQF